MLRKIFTTVVLIIVVVAFADFFSGTKDTQADRGNDAAPVRAYCSTAESRAKARRMVEQAMGGGWLTLDAESFSALIEEGFWSRLDFQGKRGMAKAIDCAIAKSGKTTATLDFRGMASGRRLARWEMGEFSIID